jgi:hypothetical protein
MRKIHTAPLEVFGAKPNGVFETEPYEAGWATEAVAMVYVREIHGPAPVLRLRAQLSVDGDRWFDPEPALTLAPISRVGGYALRIAHFGNWLRLVGEVAGGPDNHTAFLIDLYWVLK